MVGQMLALSENVLNLKNFLQFSSLLSYIFEKTKYIVMMSLKPSTKVKEEFHIMAYTPKRSLKCAQTWDSLIGPSKGYGTHVTVKASGPLVLFSFISFFFCGKCWHECKWSFLELVWRRSKNIMLLILCGVILVLNLRQK